MKAFIIFVFITTAVCTNKKLVGFWGQNVAGKNESRLAEYCKNYKYDIIVIGYVNILFDRRNAGNFPSTSFSNHCTKTFDGFPGLNKCEELEKEISACQQQGRQLLISIGGSTGDATLPAPSKAIELAHTIFDLFLGGKSDYRPFGKAKLDGINLAIEGGRHNNYADFVREIKHLDENHIITGTPSCVYPDYYLGPVKDGTVLKLAPQLFDGLFVKFFDESCSLADKSNFDKSLKSWIDFSKKGPKIFLGFPAHPRASSVDKYYQTPEQLKAMYKQLNESQLNAIGGFFIWEASYDLVNQIKGKRFSEYVANIIKP